MYVETILSRIVFSETDETHYLFLREKGGTREFPIVVGIIEAYLINRSIYNLPNPRPLTHTLLCSLVREMDGELLEVTVCDLDEDTFYAALRIKKGEQTMEIDCRPSDAIAVALAHQPPLKIMVDERVLQKARPTKWAS